MMREIDVRLAVEMKVKVNVDEDSEPFEAHDIAERVSIGIVKGALKDHIRMGFVKNIICTDLDEVI